MKRFTDHTFEEDMGPTIGAYLLARPAQLASDSLFQQGASVQNGSWMYYGREASVSRTVRFAAAQKGYQDCPSVEACTTGGTVLYCAVLCCAVSRSFVVADEFG